MGSTATAPMYMKPPATNGITYSRRGSKEASDPRGRQEFPWGVPSPLPSLSDPLTKSAYCTVVPSSPDASWRTAAARSIDTSA